MDGENNGKPIKMDDLGGKPTIFGNIHLKFVTFWFQKKMAERRWMMTWMGENGV